MMKKSSMKIKSISIFIVFILIYLLNIFIVVADSQSYELIYAEDLTFSNTESLDEADAYGEFDDIEAEISSTLSGSKWGNNCFVDAIIENAENSSYTFISLNFSVRLRFLGIGWKKTDPDYFSIQYSLDNGNTWSNDIDTFQTVSSLTTFGPYNTTASNWSEVNQTRIRIVYNQIGGQDNIIESIYIDGFLNNITYSISNPPTVITNITTGIEETNVTLHGYLTSDGGATTTCGFRYGTTSGTYTQNFSVGTKTSGQTFNNKNGSLISGDLYYYQAWAKNNFGFATGSELTFFTKPPATTNLAEISSTNTTLTYTWEKASVGTGATSYSRLQYQIGSNPTSITEGLNTYNSTGTTDNTLSLTPGTHYYFSAFSWATEAGIGNWNDTYDTMDAWTNPGDPTNTASKNGTTWINITFTHGQNGEYTMIRRNTSGNPGYPTSRTDGDLVTNTTNIYVNNTGLKVGVTFYYSLWTWDTNGNKWCDHQINITGTTLTIISISVTPSQWNLGNILIGDSNTSTGYYFNLTNDGNVPINVQIKASNATNITTGAKWNLTTTPGYNNFTLQYIKSGGGSWTTTNITYDIFVTNLDEDSWQTFDLKITYATLSSVDDPMSLDVTFKSVAS